MNEIINKAKVRRRNELTFVIYSDRASQYISKEYKKTMDKMNNRELINVKIHCLKQAKYRIKTRQFYDENITRG